MKILHYSLGFPPERSGGLIRYTMDLMNEQIRQGDEVYYLYPGHINLLKKTAYIKNDTKHVKAHFHPYSLVNSLPLPLFGGIKTPEDFMQSVDISIYHSLLQKIKPDIIHVHTLMGIHKEFFMCAKSLGIRIIFTSHDYFGLAPEPNFYYQGHNYDDNNTIEQWCKISQTAMSTFKLRLFQLSIYPFVRSVNNFLFKMKKNSKTERAANFKSDVNKKKFDELRKYYLAIFDLVDFFHFNSRLAQTIYTRFISMDVNYRCISISNSSINKNISKKQLKDPINIAYIGPFEKYKGYFEFLNLTKLPMKKNVQFHIYGDDKRIEKPINIINHGRFKPENIDNVYSGIDVLIVPSQWKETFNFTVIEGLSHGCIVIVSSNVGAKDFIPKNFIFKSVREIPNMIVDINHYKFILPPIFKKHVKKIKNLYLEIINT